MQARSRRKRTAAASQATAAAGDPPHGPSFHLMFDSRIPSRFGHGDTHPIGAGPSSRSPGNGTISPGRERTTERVGARSRRRHRPGRGVTPSGLVDSASMEILPGTWALSVPGIGAVALAPVEPPMDDPVGILDPAGILLETLSDAAGMRLILVRGPAAPPVRVNGHATLRVAILEAGDQVDVGGAVFHLALHHRPRIGPPTPDEVGRPCPVCRVPVAAADSVYQCHGCRTVLHRRSTPQPDGGVLECLDVVTACPVCSAELVLEAGFASRPEV